jgi:DNA-binding NarL/FixJ family response regulator
MGLRTMLESEPDIVIAGTAASGREALQRLPTIEVDVLLTDLRMAEMNGEEMMTQLRRTCPSLR